MGSGGGFLCQGFNDRWCYVCEIFDPVGDAFFVSSPNDGWNRIQRVITRRKVFDVAVIAGEYNGARRKPIPDNTPLTNGGEVCEDQPRGLHVLRMTNLIRDEILVERKAVFAGDARQHGRSFFGRAQTHLFAPLDERRVSEVVEHGGAGFLDPRRFETVTPAASMAAVVADTQRGRFVKNSCV